MSDTTVLTFFYFPNRYTYTYLNTPDTCAKWFSPFISSSVHVTIILWYIEIDDIVDKDINQTSIHR